MESKNENKEQKPTENQEQLDIKVVGNVIII